jgi:hypothetical protein
MNEKIQAFHLALKLADISITTQMSQFIYELKELSDEKADEISIKDIKALFEKINEMYQEQK